MTEDQIPEFVEAIIATGCPICAITADTYIIGELDVPENELERVRLELRAISARFGERDHLRQEISAYLRSIGRYFDREESTIH